MPEQKVRLMLDSGAYSAWRRGKEIDLKRYMAFIKEHASLLDSYVCLDTIPGELGLMDRSQAAIDKSAKASYRNQQIMRDAGLSPIPVFHQGERFVWLEKYLADKEPYIGVSPYSKAPRSEQFRWFDMCFSRLSDSRGRPLVRTHGFGVTWYAFLARYPWTTSDSTTWCMAPVYGKVTMPVLRSTGDAFDPLKPARQFYVGTARPKSTHFGVTRVIEELGPDTVAWIEKYAEYCGVTLTDLRNDEQARLIAQLKYFLMLENSLKKVLAPRRAEFFRAASTAVGSRSSYRMIFSASLGKGKNNMALNVCGVADRLLSYYELQGGASGARLAEYVRRGVTGGAAARSRLKPWSGAYEAARVSRLVGRLSRGESE